MCHCTAFAISLRCRHGLVLFGNDDPRSPAVTFRRKILWQCSVGVKGVDVGKRRDADGRPARELRVIGHQKGLARLAQDGLAHTDLLNVEIQKIALAIKS